MDRYALRGKAGAEDGAMGLFYGEFILFLPGAILVIGYLMLSAFNAEFGVGFALCHQGEEVFPLLGQWIMTAYDCEGNY